MFDVFLRFFVAMGPLYHIFKKSTRGIILKNSGIMKMVMNSEKFTPNSEQNIEKTNLERQKDKLVGFYLNNGDENYIFYSESNWVKDEDMPRAKEAVLEMMRDGLVPEDTERRLLTRIAGPDYHRKADGVFEDLNATDVETAKHKKRILGYMTGEKWNDYDKTSGSNVSVFLSRYPTPIDFESAAADLLRRIDDGRNDQQKVQEYYAAMDKFQYDVYGKKYEYFKAMKDLHREAAELGEPQKNEGELKESQEIGRRFFEIFNREPLVKSVGARTLNKGALTGERGRQNEDGAYCNSNTGVFAVFDGAGGGGGNPARASRLAAKVTDMMVEEKTPRTRDDLAAILEKANETIADDSEAGISTAVIGKIRDDGDHKTLVYASVGDSRIYLVRKGEDRAKQITRDEGTENYIYNFLGDNDVFNMRQTGEELLQDGDRLVFCSDGITGDFAIDFIPDEEFAHIVKSADTPDEAALALIRRATKMDDRTAVVVEV